MKSVQQLLETSLSDPSQSISWVGTEETVRIWTRHFAGFAVSYFQPLDRFVVHDSETPPDYAKVAQIVRINAPLYARFLVEGNRKLLDSVHDHFIELCVETTTKCNMRCSVCISESSPQAGEFLDILTLKQVLAQRGLPLRVTLTGGEFFVRPDWKSVAGWLMDRGVGLVISTNGALLNNRTVRHFIGAPVVFALSVDGLRETHDTVRCQPGNFKRVYEALVRLRDAGIPVHVYSVLQESNKAEMVPLSHSLAPFGIVEHRIMYVVPRGRGSDLGVPFTNEVMENLRKLRLPHVVTVK